MASAQHVWNRLRLGRGVSQALRAQRRSFTLSYVDWSCPARNTWHVVEGFPVRGKQGTTVLDLCGFVNGVPWIVVCCGGQATGVDGAARSLIDLQGSGAVARLVPLVQVWIAAFQGEVRYGTTGAEAGSWGCWREEQGPLADDPSRLAPLCSPGRLLELVRSFTVFQDGARKMARHQQYFCVRRTLDRLRVMHPEGRRSGGVIWHTQGSGKSLTMVMLAEAIRERFASESPRVVLVTDRVDLDDQIYATFASAGAEVHRAASRRDLERLLLDGQARIVTTLVHKFLKAIDPKECLSDDNNVFVLVDESHRTHSGSLHAAMRRALPRAAYLGFTGTPILRGDKATVARFGGVIHRYTIDEAVRDRTVVPLLYEGRYVPARIDESSTDDWFDRFTAGMDSGVRRDLQRHYSTRHRLSLTESRLRAIAWDISVHYRTTYQHQTPFKGQVVAASKLDAIRIHGYLEEFGVVSSAVLISAPTQREGDAGVPQGLDEVRAFWTRMLRRHGSEGNYRRELIRGFKEGESPALIVVVDMLLTGFDAPRNAVLYLVRSLREHTLLQAIARVNRTFEGKEYGLILDYYGVLGHLGEALDLYTALGERYDRADLSGVLQDIRTEVAELPRHHRDLWSLFPGVVAREVSGVQEELTLLLSERHRRREFYRRLADFARTLRMAYSCSSFLVSTPRDEAERYRRDLVGFARLRSTVARHYGDATDFEPYEVGMRKLLDRCVGGDAARILSSPVELLVPGVAGPTPSDLRPKAAGAEAIVSQMRRLIDERAAGDPVFYRRFSERLLEACHAHEQGRVQEAEHLARVHHMLDELRRRNPERAAVPPGAIAPAVQAYRDILLEELGMSENEALLHARSVEAIIQRCRIVNWTTNTDVQNRIRTAIEDELHRTSDHLDFERVDRVLDKCLGVARRRSP